MASEAGLRSLVCPKWGIVIDTELSNEGAAMKDIFRSVLGLILATLVATAQGSQASLPIDTTKPYAYIQFDRLGERQPLSENEIACGLWLRLSNNSRIPISVRVFDPGTSDPGIGLAHEVVKVSIPAWGAKSETDRPPDRSEPPVGYLLGVGSRRVVQPGRELLFAIPANHIDARWYLRVQFEFELPEV